jgi:hypothetical protein
MADMGMPEGPGEIAIKERQPTFLRLMKYPQVAPSLKKWKWLPTFHIPYYQQEYFLTL